MTRVVGVMALFARHLLSDAVISALASVADHIGLGIERHRSAEALRITEERMRFALEAGGRRDLGTWTTSPGSNGGRRPRSPLRLAARHV